MFAISVESSHKIGMGHFYRMLHFVSLLKQLNVAYFFLINNNAIIIKILTKLNEPFYVVNHLDTESNWESEYIKNFSITHWLNDRLDNNIKHFQNIKKNKIFLISFDDASSEAILSDLNIVTLPSMQQLPHYGNKIIYGIDFFIINPEVDHYKKKRNFDKINICVSLGGADTYGVTLHILRKLKQFRIFSDIHIGPAFQHIKPLKKDLISGYNLIDSPTSLISEIDKYNLLICGGGITPFEANALGIPCLIIANELFEIKNAEYLQHLKSSLFIGHHNSINWDKIKNHQKLDLTTMSQNGLKKISTHGIRNIYNEILQL